MSKGKGYFGLGTLVTIILLIFFGVFLSPIERFRRGGALRVVGGLLAFFFWPIFFFIDLITMIAFRDLTVLA